MKVVGWDKGVCMVCIGRLVCGRKGIGMCFCVGLV